MVQKDPSAEKSVSSPVLYCLPMELAEMGKKRLQATVQTQNEYLEKLQEMNREWLARVQSEAALTTDLSGKLTAARSLPEVTMAVQQWASRRMVMFAEDGHRFIANSQKLIETGARLLSDGRSGAA